ncbi:MATE family efflux transporter [Neobacillus drentensis]|nr:MATE family efflux transporter [Neobacillus drentensis]
MFSMVFFNTIMSGRYSSSDLAGVAIGTSIWSPVFNGISGIFLAVSPIAAQRFGQKKQDEVAAVVKHGIFLSVIIAIIIIVLGYFFLNPILDLMKLSPRVQETAFDYLVGLSYGLLPLFIFNVLRSFIYALGKTRVIMVIMLLSLPINLVLNYVLIFGKLGFPELGGVGAGYATAITDWIFLGMTIFIVKKQDPFSSFQIFSKIKEFSWEQCKEILQIGVPMGLSVFFETTVFAIVTILLSKFNVTTIAAYQSALNVVSFIYMIPISISTALTVLVGYEVGAKRYKDAKQYSWLGVGIAVLIAIGTGLVVVAFRYQVAGLYSTEAAVINLTANFLIFALFFQICDAIQATAQAALRGYKDVNIAFIMTLVAYWLICLPAGYLLANFTSLGARGYWIGLTIGLLAAGIALSIRLIHIQKNRYSAAATQ